MIDGSTQGPSGRSHCPARIDPLLPVGGAAFERFKVLDELAFCNQCFVL